MKIENHRLFESQEKPVDFVESPNLSGRLEHRLLVMHYTAGRSAQQSVSWLANSMSRASAHLVIGRDGTITQLVPFDRVAWHAGRSHWEDLDGLNRYAIGIELDNAGKLIRHGEKWRAWFGDEYSDDEVIEAVHKHEDTPSGWHLFSPKQIETALNAALVLIDAYGLKDVVGHDDIAPKRKCDPGPAFPMGSFKSRLVGRAEETPDRFKTKTFLNIRSGPGTQHSTLIGSPLPTGTKVEILDRAGSWVLVDVLKAVNGVMDLQGWVHSRYLTRIS